MTAPVVLVGFGLHGGAPAVVRLETREGPVVLCARGHAAEVAALRVVGTVRAMTVESPAKTFRVRTVDHLFAACAGLGVRRGLAIVLEVGDELPLLDGSAARFAAAVGALGLPAAPPALRVVGDAVLDVRASRFTFAAPKGVDARASVRVSVDFGDERLAPEARWEGDPADFVARIASARTFAFAEEIEGLLDRGLAKHVAPESVVVLAKDRIHCAGAPFTADEPARHKLLDLLGDMYLYGGPPLGHVHAHRPGHGANHEAMARALREGVLAAAQPK